MTVWHIIDKVTSLCGIVALSAWAWWIFKNKVFIKSNNPKQMSDKKTNDNYDSSTNDSVKPFHDNTISQENNENNQKRT